MSQETWIDRPLPHNEEVERVLLGAILAGHRERESLLDSLSVDDFFELRHQKICTAMLHLRDKSQPVDLLTVSDELSQSLKLEAAGGIDYLAQLGDGIARAQHVQHYLRTLRDKARRRKLLHELEKIKAATFDGEEVAEELCDRTIEAASEILRASEADRDEPVSFRDAAASLLQSLQAGSGPRIFTDLLGLDEITGGARGGEVWMITGGTGHGKSLFVQQMCRRACRDGHHALVCSGEMLAPHFVSRGLAAQARVKPWKLRLSERLDDDDWRRLTQAASEECNVCRILDKELSLARFRRVARRLKGRHGLGLVVVDYDELVEAPGENEFEQQRSLVRGAKSLAMELEIPIVIVSQLRKTPSAEDVMKPTLTSLYGSGAKSKHASCVVFVDRPYVRDLKGDETEARIFVLKNRDGRVGRVKASFSIDTLRFVDAVEASSEPSGSENSRLPYRDGAETR